MTSSLVRFLVRLDDALEAAVRPVLSRRWAVVALVGLFAWAAIGWKRAQVHDGDFVRGHGPEMYRVENGKLRRLVDWNTFVKSGGKADFSNLRTLAPERFRAIPYGAPIAADGTFVKGSGAEIYKMEGQRKRHITDWGLFIQLGGRADLHNVVFLHDRELKRITDGDPIKPDGPAKKELDGAFCL